MRLCNVVGKMEFRVERFDVGPCSLFMEKSPSTYYGAPSPEVSNGATDPQKPLTDAQGLWKLRGRHLLTLNEAQRRGSRDDA